MSTKYPNGSYPITRSAEEVKKGKAGLPLRKSCQFCRSRKIRCSGQSICSACRQRNIECSYGACGQKGRPRGPTRTSSQENSRRNSRTPTPCLDTYHSRRNSEGQPLGQFCDSKIETSVLSVAVRLEDMFNRLMGYASGETSNPADELLEQISTSNLPQVPAQDPFSKPLSYDTMFFTFAPDLIEIISSRLDHFSPHELDSARSRYFARTFLTDKCTTMFNDSFTSNEYESRAPYGNPSGESNGHLMVQLLDIWFSQHPLSFMIAKTLLLRDIRNGAYDEVLVASMLADVQYVQLNELDCDEGVRLFNWVTTKLQKVPQNKPTLSTIQTVILLGWRCLCFGNARRAICYLFWAEEALDSFPSPQAGVNTINGIDIGEIERQSHRNASWLVFSIKLWAMLQINIPGIERPPSSAPPFTSIDESGLQSFKLDRTSHNLATLQTQERMFREMCLLSHIAAIAGRVIAVYPPGEQMGGLDIFQSHNYQPNQGFTNITKLCVKVRSVLLDFFPSSKNDIQYGYHHRLALCASHTLLIHCLFSTIYSDEHVHRSSTNPTPHIATGNICQPILDFCVAAKSLLQIFSTLITTDNEGANPSRILMTQQLTSKHDLFALALNACGQAMNKIYNQGQNGTDIERTCIRENASELARLATELHTFSKDPSFISPRLKGAKKLLKHAVYHFTAPQMNFSGSCTSTSTPSCTGSQVIPEAELNAAFDNTDFSFGYNHTSTTVAGIECAGFYGFGLPMISDDGYDSGMNTGWGVNGNVYDMREGGMRQ